MLWGEVFWERRRLSKPVLSGGLVPGLILLEKFAAFGRWRLNSIQKVFNEVFSSLKPAE